LTPRAYTLRKGAKNYTELSLIRKSHNLVFDSNKEADNYRRWNTYYRVKPSDIYNTSFQAVFYGEVSAKLKLINEKIDNDLTDDPRWAVFLINRKNSLPVMQ